MSDTDPYAAPEAPAVEKKIVEKASETPVEVAQKAPEPVPEGPAKTVLAWVGSDKEKATEALATEKEGQKRSTLITKLNDIIGD